MSEPSKAEREEWRRLADAVGWNADRDEWEIAHGLLRLLSALEAAEGREERLREVLERIDTAASIHSRYPRDGSAFDNGYHDGRADAAACVRDRARAALSPSKPEPSHE